MSYHELKRTSKVLVVEKNKELRYMIHNAIRKIGFRKISGVASITEALSHLNTEDVDWLLLPFDDAHFEQVFQILKMASIYPELHDMKISAFVSPGDDRYLSQAYEWGLLSTFEAPQNKTNIEQPLDNFQKILSGHNNDSCLTAAEYLRAFLLRTERIPGLLRFEEALIQLYNGNTELLLNLATAQALSGDEPHAAGTLLQATYVNPELKEDADNIRENFFKDKFADAQAKSVGGNILGLEKVMIVDPDETCANRVEEILRGIGVRSIIRFENPLDAVQALDGDPPPSMIIQEWKLPKMSGPIFAQRVRQAGLTDIPLIVLSSLVNQNDMPLIGEIGVSQVIAKPLERKAFLKGLVWTCQQMQRPTEKRGFELKFHALIGKKKVRQAGALLGRYIKDQRLDEADIYYFKAALAYAQQKYKAARIHGFAAIKAGQRTVRVFNLVGKALMKLRDFENALKCFNNANQSSPMNIIRLCSIAEAHAELGQEKLATSILGQLKSLDPRNNKIAITEANFGITHGDLKKAHKIMSEIENIDDIMGFLNNRGIALARAQKIDAAVDFYKRALQAIPEEKLIKRELVYYNLALAYARGGYLDEAQKELNNLKKTTNLRVAAKAGRLKSKIKEAKKKNGKVALVTREADESETVDLPKISGAQAGFMCCFMLFKETERERQNTYSIKSIPAFRSHGSLSSGEFR